MRLKNIVRFALLGLTTGCGDPAGAPADLRSGDAEPTVSDVLPIAAEAPPATEPAPPEPLDPPRSEAAVLLLDPALVEHPGLRPAVSRAAPFWDRQRERITVSP